MCNEFLNRSVYREFPESGNLIPIEDNYQTVELSLSGQVGDGSRHFFKIGVWNLNFITKTLIQFFSSDFHK